MEQEIWKDVKGFEGYYQVSNMGRLKSFKRSSNGYILSNKNKNGDYLRCTLLEYGHNNGVTILLHRLVYETFVGEIPPKHDIDHIDSNRQNNKLSNLQCLDKKSHVAKTIKHNPNCLRGMINRNKHEQDGIIQLSLAGRFISMFSNAKEASRQTGVCARNISQVARGTEYKPGKVRSQAGGFKWEVAPLIGIE